jgi:hypothetical protein
MEAAVSMRTKYFVQALVAQFMCRHAFADAVCRSIDAGELLRSFGESRQGGTMKISTTNFGWMDSGQRRSLFSTIDAVLKEVATAFAQNPSESITVKQNKLRFCFRLEEETGVANPDDILPAMYRDCSLTITYVE